ncbi:hypothetical protein PQC06_gp083 [Aeromonas phage LAh10]|uniref:Uncharacterized protein n=1 Tax=Aeromonas phage LAh10 TaxID=2591025 RepID=A0A514A1Q8_9CAUD|nr:hypothetical protein PQC06_gp083 [Aeromonas phage LAh10]QDH47211.1 hypothetical protein LAh10_83 [Aeromonas phage LAh10]
MKPIRINPRAQAINVDYLPTPKQLEEWHDEDAVINHLAKKVLTKWYQVPANKVEKDKALLFLPQGKLYDTLIPKMGINKRDAFNHMVIVHGMTNPGSLQLHLMMYFLCKWFTKSSLRTYSET